MTTTQTQQKQDVSTTWQLDPTHSTVEFGVRHLMISTVKGRFTDVTGTVTFDPAKPAKASVDVTISAPSITTGVQQRDDHLRSPDFLDTANFPTITFKSRTVEPVGDGSLKVTGDLTIRGTTREVVFVTTPEGQGNDPWGNERRAFEAATRINRSDFGLTWNQALETGGVVVGDEVKIAIEVELMRKRQQAAA